MDYGFVHNGKVFTPNDTADVSLSDNDARNAELTRAELATWQTRPDHMVAYYKLASEENTQSRQYREAFRIHGSVSTWTGSPLGIVTEARVYRHNFGGRMVSLRVRGNNGAEYYGRASYDWGSCIKLRKVKV